MTKIVVAVFDTVARQYSVVHVEPSREAAVRTFTDALGRGDTMLSRHPDDYQLVELGEFLDDEGVIEGLAAPFVLITGSEVVRRMQGEGDVDVLPQLQDA